MFDCSVENRKKVCTLSQFEVQIKKISNIDSQKDNSLSARVPFDFKKPDVSKKREVGNKSLDTSWNQSFVMMTHLILLLMF